MNAVCVEQSNVRVQCDTTYRQIFNGQNVIFACRRQANDALLHYPSSIAAADVLIKTRIEEIKYLSTKDRQNVERRQLMMVVSLAMIANNEFSYRVHLHFLHGHVSPGRLSANAGFGIVSSP